MFIFPGLRVLLLAVVTASAVAATALAHAQLILAVPPEGAMLAQQPAAARLTFNEPVEVLALSLVAPDGSVAHIADAYRDGVTLVVPLPAATDGTRLLGWRVMSADGHPVGGEVSFSVGRQSEPPAPDLAGDQPIVKTVLWLGRLVLALAACVGIGGSLFAAAVDPDGRAPAWTRRSTLVAMAAVPLALAVLVVGEGLDDLAAAPDVANWRLGLAAGLHSPFLRTAVLLLAALVPAFAALRLVGWIRVVAAVVGSALAAAAFAASGHAASAEPSGWTQFAVFVHAAALIFWLGALLPLGAIAGAGSPYLAAVIHRFSRIALPAVVLLVASGMLLAIVQVDRPEDLVATDYGHVLLAKLALVGLLLLAAVVNRTVLTPRIAAGDRLATIWFRRSVTVEIGLAVAILGVAGLWRLTPPPRALRAADQAGITLHLHRAEVMADIIVSPGRAGPNRIDLGLLTGDFGPIAPRDVRVRFSRSTPGSALAEAAGHLGADGRWAVDDISIPTPGHYKMSVDVRVDAATFGLSGDIDLRP